MLNLHIITFLCIVSCLLNIMIPILENTKFTFFLLSQVAAIGGVYVYGWVSSRNTQSIPLAADFIIRALQALIFIYWRKDLSWISFGVLIFLDCLFLLLLVLDKSSYKYEYITRENDEFFGN